MAHYIGVDVGTTKIAVLILDAESGRAIVSREMPSAAETTSAEDKARGRSEWDAEAMMQTVLACLRDAVADAPPLDVHGIGVSGQMHGMLLVANGRPVSPLIGWQDQRGQEMVPGETINYIEKMLQMGGVGGFARTGSPPATGYLGATLFWMAQTGDERAKKGGPTDLRACFMPDYIVSRLAGIKPVTDCTNAGGSGIFDVARRKWNSTLLERLGLNEAILPPILPCGSVAGELASDAAEATGLKKGTPVCVACGDNQASFAGAVADPENSIFVNIGTGAQVSAWVPKYLTTESLDVRPYLDEGYLLVGAPLCGGYSYALLRDFFRQVGTAFFEGEGDDDILYARMTALAQTIAPGADGLKCEPLFTGTRLDPNRRATWSGVSPGNFTPGHFARAILEGIVEQVLQYYREMLSGGVKPREALIVSGNGVRKNPLLAQILPEMFGMRMRVTVSTEEAAFGAALLAAIGTGRFSSLKEASGLIRYL